MLYLLLSLHSLSCPNILDMIQAQKYGYVHDSEYISSGFWECASIRACFVRASASGFYA